MRVTSATKAATRRQILDAAHRLFAEKGFGATTTRDIAQAAGIASGTLFNYFPAKEAVLACLAERASEDAIAEASGRSSGGETLEEDLFALVAAGLRKLKHLRIHLPALLETALSPIAAAAAAAARDGESASLRVAHLEAVAALAARHGHPDLSPTALQLYWTLYTGVLAFWANDSSPNQEDTLALTDASLNMFAGWLRAQPRTDPAPPAP
jgi:AcrR family transcriptional regulator